MSPSLDVPFTMNLTKTLVSYLSITQIVHVDIHVYSHFFSHQNFNYLCTPTDDGFIPRVTVNPDFSFGAVRKAVAEIKERLEEFGREELLKISKSGLTLAAETQYCYMMGREQQNKKPSLLNMNVFCLTVNEVPVYTTESRTLDRRSRGERCHVS